MKLTVIAPFNIITGSHAHNLGGTGYRTVAVGEVIDAQDVLNPESSNVWITTADGERGKIECGSWKNRLGENWVITQDATSIVGGAA